MITDVPNPDEPKTGIHIDEIRLTADHDMVLRANIKANALLASTSLIRMPNGTVFKLTEEETRVMEELWGVGASFSPASSATEGDRKLRSHFVRERSPRLRADKLKAFRASHDKLHCEICAEEVGEGYPEAYRDKVFEVHHRAPLSAASEPVRTTLDDLAILCANCHRSVHATKDVDDNFQRLKMHFAERS
mgnify:CR=1 FL=1